MPPFRTPASFRLLGLGTSNHTNVTFWATALSGPLFGRTKASPRHSINVQIHVSFGPNIAGGAAPLALRLTFRVRTTTSLSDSFTEIGSPLILLALMRVNTSLDLRRSSIHLLRMVGGPRTPAHPFSVPTRKGPCSVDSRGVQSNPLNSQSLTCLCPFTVSHLLVHRGTVNHTW